MFFRFSMPTTAGNTISAAVFFQNSGIAFTNYSAWGPYNNFFKTSDNLL